jgi:membrane protein YdbS with pleckstrin-like domain
VSNRSDRAAAWIYRGIWARLVAWFKVPGEPPSLPGTDAQDVAQFRPAPSFLKYLKFWFWFALLAMDGAILIAWIVIAIRSPAAGVLLAAPALAVAVLPDIVVYVALHLRFDTTWYVMSGRSLRIRRGIWVLREMTITFENVQNIKVTQGPLMRYYGIKNLVVETAGAAGGSAHERFGPAENQAVVEGVANADELRELILARVRASRSAGLGDEAAGAPRAVPTSTLTGEHVRLLREIRDAAAALAR